MAAYRLSPQARRDLEGIWRYSWERWSKDQADRYYMAIIEAFEDLEAGRKAGRPLAIAKRGYLSLACGSHFIIYAQRKQTVEIIRILHQRMNIGRHL
ncbi:MAG: type II toxin-antitoxin system RelE/ParE family toxin [Agrobacterium albertimagni]|jgi:toxin ParE1/3/4|uniref:type II toxin-antitoxin system RelE/ParE family toxin n=1 Tax=Agrobacterium albertimagni TaxID=147266 RepID=UPI000591546A|nr:type II toxin-antitoxin system RelE/ParE family toxin [Agrobacterium albertimagni]